MVNSAPDAEHFVADLAIKRASRNGARLIYIGPDANRTSEVAEVFLRCASGAQLDVLDAVVAAELALDAARLLAASILKVLVFNRDFRGSRVAIILGEDPLGTPGLPADLRAGLAACEFLVVGDLFFTGTARAAHVVLPLASPAETSGTFTSAERRVQQIHRAVPPRAGLETWDVLCQLAAKTGFRFKMRYGSPADVLAEIRRVTPTYRDVVVDSLDTDGRWDAGKLPAAGAAGDSGEAGAGA